ncbi:MAG: DUF58 domain-containing protein [Phycisphaerae bacterium]
MNVPGKATIWSFAAIAALLLPAALSPAFMYIALSLDSVIVLLFIFDAVVLNRTAIRVTPEFPVRGEMNAALKLVYRVENSSERTVILTLEHPWPEGLSGTPPKINLTVHGRESVLVAFEITPIARGPLELAPVIVSLRFALPWALRRTVGPVPPPIRIYPDLRGIRRFEILRQHHTLGMMGLHRRRMLGSGREFEQLRDYLPDDDFRDINWKSSAHHQRLITTVFQVERRQDVLLCLDAGRMMANPMGTRTMLDCAIDAAIMLGHVVIRQNDHIGAVVFRDTVSAFIKPSGSTSAMRHVIDALTDCKPEPVYPSYAALASAIRVRQNKRCMIFLFTDLNDPQLAENLWEAAVLLRHRHLLTVVSLRDPLLDRIAAGPTATQDRLFQSLAARKLATERDSRKRKLAMAGANLIESDADTLSLRTINTYLAIKSRQMA